MAQTPVLKWTKVAFMSLVYLLLAGFMLFVAVRTYQFAGGLSDVGTVAVVVGMALLTLLIIRLGYRNLRGAVSA